MRIIDVSIPINENTVVWDDEFVPEIKEFGKIKDGDVANSSCIRMSLHTATHIDFPRHFFSEGKAQEDFSLDKYYGKVYVVEISDDPITAEALQRGGIPSHTKKLLIKAGNSKLYKNKKFSKEFNALSDSGADWLVERGIELVGIDYLSIEKYENNDYYVHKTLLKNDILIIEGLNLEKVKEGEYEIYALPLKIPAKDAAPVRVFLIER